ATDGPLPGREEDWSLVAEYRVGLAQEARQWAEAERLQRATVEWQRGRAAAALAAPLAAADAAGRNAIRSLGVSLNGLADILREQNRAECVQAYQENYELRLRIEDRPGAAIAAYNLGRAYTGIPALRDLAQAEHWFRRS